MFTLGLQNIKISVILHRYLVQIEKKLFVKLYIFTYLGLNCQNNVSISDQ